MKYIKSFLFILLLSACMPVTQTAMVNPKRLSAIQQIQLTETPIPIPTIDYQATLVVVNDMAHSAVQTADAAMRLQTEATAAHEQIVQQNIQYTHEADLLTAQSIAWTVTSAPTSYALTQTQQAVVNTQIPVQQALLAAQITSTYEAPGQSLKMANAENVQKYGFIEYLVRYLLYLSVAFFLVLLGLWLRSKPAQQVQIIHIKDEQPFIVPIDDYAKVNQQPETIVAVENNTVNYQTKDRFVFPCTPSQLDELADKIINQGISLAYDNFAGKNSLFTRDTFGPVYSFFLSHRLAKSSGIRNKGVIVTDRDFGELNGTDILRGWIETRTLPVQFTLPAPLPDTIEPKTDIRPPENTRISEPLTSENTAGEGVNSSYRNAPQAFIPELD